MQIGRDLEAATAGALWKKMFLKVSQNSLENTCARVSYWKTLAQAFSCEICEIFINNFFAEHLCVTRDYIGIINSNKKNLPISEN